MDHRCVITDMAAENCFEARQRMYCRGSVITCLFSEFLSYIKVDDQRVCMGVVKPLVVAFISKLPLELDIRYWITYIIVL